MRPPLGVRGKHRKKSIMNEVRYNKLLKELEEIDPGHRFLALLRGGYSVVNVVYLEKAFADIPQDSTRVISQRVDHRGVAKFGLPQDGTKTPLVKMVEDDAGDDNGFGIEFSADNEVLSELDLQRRGLYYELFTERKKFFDYPFTPPYNRERAAVSDAVQRIQRRIGALRERVRVYLDSGVLPDVVDDSEKEDIFVVPTDPYKRMQKVNSLRASISRANREWRTLVAIDQERAKEKEKTILYLKGCLAQVLSVIENEN